MHLDVEHDYCFFADMLFATLQAYSKTRRGEDKRNGDPCEGQGPSKGEEQRGSDL